MGNIRKNYTSEEKARIALEALKGSMTISQITGKYGVHASQISKWKKRLQSGLSDIFSERKKRKDEDQSDLINELYQTIGRQKIELEWLKKKSELFKD